MQASRDRQLHTLLHRQRLTSAHRTLRHHNSQLSQCIISCLPPKVCAQQAPSLLGLHLSICCCKQWESRRLSHTSRSRQDWMVAAGSGCNSNCNTHDGRATHSKLCDLSLGVSQSSFLRLVLKRPVRQSIDRGYSHTAASHLNGAVEVFASSCCCLILLLLVYHLLQQHLFTQRISHQEPRTVTTRIAPYLLPYGSLEATECSASVHCSRLRH